MTASITAQAEGTTQAAALGANQAGTNSGPRSAFDISPATRRLVGLAATLMCAACLYAFMRLAMGMAPAHPNLRDAAIMLHVSTVLPAIPLGAYLLLARKGTKRHKQLGKLWIALMVATALSAVFIKTSGHFSPIHIFVPLTLIGAWKTISTARAGNMTGHKKQIMGLYFGALMIPGIVAFALPGRLMNMLMFG